MAIDGINANVKPQSPIQTSDGIIYTTQEPAAQEIVSLIPSQDSEQKTNNWKTLFAWAAGLGAVALASLYILGRIKNRNAAEEIFSIKGISEQAKQMKNRALLLVGKENDQGGRPVVLTNNLKDLQRQEEKGNLDKLTPEKMLVVKIGDDGEFKGFGNLQLAAHIKTGWEAVLGRVGLTNSSNKYSVADNANKQAAPQSNSSKTPVAA